MFGVKKENLGIFCEQALLTQSLLKVTLGLANDELPQFGCILREFGNVFANSA